MRTTINIVRDIDVELFIEDIFNDMNDEDKKEMADLLKAEQFDLEEPPEHLGDKIKAALMPHDLDRLIERLRQ